MLPGPLDFPAAAGDADAEAALILLAAQPAPDPTQTLDPKPLNPETLHPETPPLLHRGLSLGLQEGQRHGAVGCACCRLCHMNSSSSSCWALLLSTLEGRGQGGLCVDREAADHPEIRGLESKALSRREETDKQR